MNAAKRKEDQKVKEQVKKEDQKIKRARVDVKKDTVRESLHVGMKENTRSIERLFESRKKRV